MGPLPSFPGEPRNRREIAAYLARRADFFKAQGQPEPPLSAREYLMFQRLGSTRPAYSLT